MAIAIGNTEHDLVDITIIDESNTEHDLTLEYTLHQGVPMYLVATDTLSNRIQGKVSELSRSTSQPLLQVAPVITGRRALLLVPTGGGIDSVRLGTVTRVSEPHPASA